MPASNFLRKPLLTLLVIAGLPIAARTEPSATLLPPASKAPELHDGQHDFDWELGTWKTHLKRRLHPLTGSTAWVEYDGTTVVRPVWNGGANLVELEVSGAGGKIEALALRLYNPQSHQWSLNFSNRAGGTMAIPTVGSFNGRRGADAYAVVRRRRHGDRVRRVLFR